MFHCLQLLPTPVLIVSKSHISSPVLDGRHFPHQVVLFAAFLNLVGDFFLCCWPFQLGIFGAAAATAVSTLMGFQMMWQALKRTPVLDGRKFSFPLFLEC